MMNTWKACMVDLFPLYNCKCYASMYFFNPMHFFFMLMGPIRPFDSSRVLVTSSPSLGLWVGAWKCGIRAHVVAWASIGHEEQWWRKCYPLTSTQKMYGTHNIFQNFPKCWKFSYIVLVGWVLPVQCMLNWLSWVDGMFSWWREIKNKISKNF